MPVDYAGVGDPKSLVFVRPPWWKFTVAWRCHIYLCLSVNPMVKLTCWSIPLVLRPGPLIPTPLLPSGFMRYPSFYDKPILLPHRCRSLLHTTSPGLHLTRRRTGEARSRLA